MNKLLLRLLLLATPLWRSMGADTDQLKAILTMRLLIDDRKPIGMRQIKNNQIDINNGSVTNAFIYMVMGTIYAIPVLLIPDRIFSITLNLTLLSLILTLTLISDFSNTLFDNRDKYILFPRPVSDHTLVLAKMLHLFIYLLRIILPMSLPTIVALGYLDGLASPLLYLFPLTLMVCLALFMVNAVYLLILQLASPARFKDILNYFQISTSIVFFGIFYLRQDIMFNTRDVIDYASVSWIQYTPVYWLATMWTWLGWLAPYAKGPAITAAGIVTPLFCAFVLIKWLAPRFSRKISEIDSAEVTLPSKPKTANAKPGGKKFYLTLAAIFNRNDDGKAGFIITWLQTSRSRTFRMRVYPSFAFVPIYFIFLLTQNGKSISVALAKVSGTSMHLLLLYMSSFVLMNGLNYLAMSENYKAAWVFYAAPTPVPGKIMAGALKALWAKFFLPFFAVLSAFTIYIWGPAAISDVLLALVNVTLMMTVIARVIIRSLPFSSMERVKQSAGKTIRGMLAMFIPMVLGFGHYFAIHLLWLKIIFMILSAILLWLVLDSYSNTSWETVRKEEANG